MKDIRQGLMASNNLFKEKLFRIKSNIYVRMLQTRVREKRISIGNIQLKMKLRHTNIQIFNQGHLLLNQQDVCLCFFCIQKISLLLFTFTVRFLSTLVEGNYASPTLPPKKKTVVKKITSQPLFTMAQKQNYIFLNQNLKFRGKIYQILDFFA